ncbi:MAG TPA: alpha/beta hydrolase-fold protein [Polyangia bacterium]|jgi:enterochelin esterase-like enzyme|nr:alpha/beta hydrolase-fold protein [Polyangia bacterium]
MKRRYVSIAEQSLILLGSLLIFGSFAACSAGGGGRTGAAGTGAAGTGAAGAAGTGGTGADAGASAAGSSGGAGAAATGVGGTSGAAGAAATGGSGVTDAGQSDATGTAGATDSGATGASASMGTQADPGTDGDGTFPLNPPYNEAPEEMALMNGAKTGQVLGPFIHTQTGTYTNWSTWKFTYYVFVPAEYKPGHAAALMIFNDGYLYCAVDGKLGTSTQDSEVHFNAPTVIENLINEGSMPVTIAVCIFPGTNDGHQVGGGDGGRSTQYDTANDQYGKFLEEEFLPAEILNKYTIVTDPDGWALGGHSSGGIASITQSWFHNDRWHKAVTASPSFPNAGGKFPNMFKTMAAKPMRVYHTAGTMDLGGFRAANDSAAMILQMLGAPTHDRYMQTMDVHYPPHAAMADFPNAMRWAWRGYKTPP